MEPSGLTSFFQLCWPISGQSQVSADRATERKEEAASKRFWLEPRFPTAEGLELSKSPKVSWIWPFSSEKNGCIPQSVYDYVPFPSKRGTSAKWKHLPNSGLCFKVDWIPREFQQSPTTPRAIFKLTTIKCRFWHLSSSLLLSSIFLLHSPPSPLGERVGGKRENVHIRGRFIKAQSSLNGVWKMKGYFTLESLYTLLHKRSLGV